MGKVLLVSACHLTADTYLTFVAALLPYFVTRWGISLTEAGALVTALFSAAYFAQPVFGWISDRVGGRWLLVGGPMVAACFIGTLGLLPSFAWALPCVILGGLGSAAFHPIGANLVMRAGGSRRSLSMSIFITSGLMGFAVGPLEVLSVVAPLGLKFTFLTIFPGLAACLLLLKYGSFQKDPAAEGKKPAPVSQLFGAWRPLAIHWTITVIRSGAYGAFGSFLLLLLQERGLSIWAGGTALSAFLVVAAVGSIVGGFLGDRFDRRTITVLTMGLAASSLGAFLMMRGPVSIMLLVVGAFLMMLSNPFNVVMPQEMFPAHAGFLASLMMGVAYGVGSLGIVGVGAVADRLGLPVTMTGVVVVVFLGALLGLRIPRQGATAPVPESGPFPVEP
jgi:FSR family fosmidomycin resistance protein-like MFS transporter